MDRRSSYLIAVVLAFVLALPASAAAQTPTAGAPAEQLTGVMDRLAGIIGQLAMRDSLTPAQTQTLQQELARVYRDLEAVRNRLGGSPDVALPAVGGVPPEEVGRAGAAENRSDVWTRFGEATVRVTPENARFTGWAPNNNMELSYGDGGEIVLRVDNGGYRADWRLRDAYVGSVRTTISSRGNGDVQLTVNDSRGTHEFLIKDGGIGPIYARGLTIPDEAPFPETGPVEQRGVVRPPARNDQPETAEPIRPEPANGAPPGVWYRQYRNAVVRGELASSAAMDWLIAQYEDNSFASVRLREFAVMLSELEGEPTRTSVATLHFNQGGEERSQAFPDPRANPGEFASVVAILHELHQGRRWYELELAR